MSADDSLTSLVVNDRKQIAEKGPKIQTLTQSKSNDEEQKYLEDEILSNMTKEEANLLKAAITYNNEDNILVFTDLIGFKLRWHHIGSALMHEMGQDVSSKFMAIVNKLSNNAPIGLSEEIKQKLLKQKMMKREVAHIEILYVLNGSAKGDLTKNHFVGMEFYIFGNVVCCYFVKGINEKIRFWPQFIPFFIERLFKRDYDKMSDAEFVRKCHSNSVKNGFCVDLSDETFNTQYHKLMKRLFIEVNYDRKYVKYESNEFEYVNKGKLAKSECTKEQRMSVSECPLIAFIVETLKKSESESNKMEFEITEALDHLISVHSFCRDIEQREKIKEYVQSKVSGLCKHKSECQILREFTGRRRERAHTQQNKKKEIFVDAFLSLHCYLLHDQTMTFRSNMNPKNNKFGSSVQQSKKTLKFMDNFDILFEAILDFDDAKSDFDERMFFINHINAWSKHNDFDFDALIADLIETDSKHSVFYKFLSSIGKEAHFESIYIAMDQINKNNEKNDVDALKAHIRNDPVFDSKQIFHFYRWIKEKEIDWNKLTKDETVSDILNEFGQKMYEKIVTFVKEQNEKKRDIASINFGVPVHEWLRYGEKPKFKTFKEEMIDKLGEDLYDKYKVKCIALMRILADQQWALKELMSVKVYTDTTDLCKLFRMIHWTDNDDKKSDFFWWALTLFIAVQYHKQPLIKRSQDSPIPIALYHGLSTLFVVESGCPFYNGPISTTSARTVGEQFCKNGLLWFILSSYTNPYRRICGISVERISCFAEECEVLLCNSYLPISKTQNLANDDNVKIDLLMTQIQKYRQKEINVTNFYNSIGFRVKKEWIPMMKRHKLMYEPLTHFADKMVIHRLVNDFGLDEFDVLYTILTSKFTMNAQLRYFVNTSRKLQIDAKYCDDLKMCQYKLVYDNDKASAEMIVCDKPISLKAKNECKEAVIFVSSKKIFHTTKEFELQRIQIRANQNEFAADYFEFDEYAKCFQPKSMKMSNEMNESLKNALYQIKYENPFNSKQAAIYGQICKITEMYNFKISVDCQRKYRANLMVSPFKEKKVSYDADIRGDNDGILRNFDTVRITPKKYEKLLKDVSNNYNFLIEGNAENPPFFNVNLGEYGAKINGYLLKNSNNKKGVLINWTLSASNDGIQWIALKEHKNDYSLKEVGAYESAQWKTNNDQTNAYFSYFKVVMNGRNDLKATSHLNKWAFGCCHFEIFGEFTKDFDRSYHDEICITSHTPKTLQLLNVDAAIKLTAMDGKINKHAVNDQMRWFEDDYVKEEPLGEPGTFGMAFKCYKKTDKHKEPFAVKQIDKAKFYFTEQKGILTNMKTEIKIMRILHSGKHICTLHDTYEDRNYIYLVLDYLSGGGLYARIKERGELKEREAQQITKQILSALEFMQMHKIAHLDLKPDNILFADKSPDSIIKLIDFGQGQVVEDDEKTDQNIGTPYYMAPEIVRGDPYDPFAADMWSLGVIIFCMLFGFVPFLAEEEDEIFAKIKKGFKPQVMDGYGAFFPAGIPISQPARDIISGLLISDPSLRLTVNDCLKHPWMRGNVFTLPTAESSFMVKQNRPQQLNEIDESFLVYENSIDISSDEKEMNDFEEAYMNVPGNGIIQMGYMKNEGKLYKSWKKRWFILTNNGNVTYYENNQTLDKPLGQFSIRGNMINVTKSTKIKNCIILYTTERGWKFVCANDKQQNEWIKAFQSVQDGILTNSKKHTLQDHLQNKMTM